MIHSIRFTLKLICLSSILILASCSNKSKVSKSSEIESQTSSEITTKISTRTKLLLSSLKKEQEASKLDKNAFVPSKELAEEYSITKLSDGIHYIKGLATLNKAFDENILTQLNIKSGSGLGNQNSLHIPLLNFEAFLKSPHITYFEIAEKSTLKK